MLDDHRAVLDRLCAADPSTLANEEAVIALHRNLARLEAVTTRATAAFEASGRWQRSGARTAAIWVSIRANLAKAVAKRRVALGRCLRHLPATESAWLAGDINQSHVSALARARNPV
ncbi:MAG: DUF222 domain-containing protein, partial [Acidimicrobiales bacterium]